jgi:crotonobetainyl-CoA:carnitine CoA-transferase CaiB-like acyl-CoA transferase
MAGALSHLRVLDLTRVLAGPWCAQTLADLGAEVIKIERPGTGDDTRAWGPPYLKDAQGRETGEAAYFASCNRGKKSVTLDIASPEGRSLARRLAAVSDVFIENYKVGDLARYGLAYGDLRTINPRLVYCSITGYGQDGPYSRRAGYDFMVQGMGGFMSITGESDDRPGGGPQKGGVAVTDLMTGMYAAVAILAAIERRHDSGEGQYIDMALLDVGVGMLSNMHLNYFATGRPPKRWGNAHPNIVPYQVFACADGHVILGAGNDAQFRKFCEVAARTDLPADERFSTNDARVRNREALVPILEDIMKRRRRDEWVSMLDAAGVPSGPINNIDQVFEDPQVRHRGMKIEAPHPLAGRVPMVRNPILMSGTPIEYPSGPPTLGQHTEEVLGGVLDLGREEIAALRERRVI